MATVPSARTTLQDTAGAAAGGLDTICLWTPAALNADAVPRQFGSAAAVYAQHGYCPGVEYAALHAERTRKPFLVCALPITTPGVIGREDVSGNSGGSATTVSAGGDGVLFEHDGVLKVEQGGIVGTDQIILSLSLDGGRKFKRVRLGDEVSYTVPYVGASIDFTVGTLVAGETIHTWHGTGPLCDDAGWLAARGNLAAQQKGFRSILLLGDLRDSTEAGAFTDQMNAYETANERFVYGRASVYDRAPQASMSQLRVRMTGSPNLTFLEVGGTGDTITRSSGSWIADGFAVGDIITVSGSVSNNVTGPIASLSATVITLGTTDLVNEGPVGSVTVYGTPSLTFAEVGGTGDTLTRSRGSWLADGFREGDLVTVDGTASNDFTATAGIDTVTATVITFDTTDLAAEVIGSYGVSVSVGQTKAAWMAEIDAEFASVDDEIRVDLSAGRGRELSPFSLWNFRLPAAWAASIREFQHDAHIPVWRKDDGPTGFDLFDAEKNLVEWDDHVDGGAGSAARFTTFRTWANGPEGAFLTLSLTRGNEASLMSQTQNVAVLDLAMTITQRNTETAAVGQSLVLNDDGTATKDSLSTIASRVNSALELGLLTSRLEGPRASKAVWTPSEDDVLNVPEALLTGSLDLNLNGTVHSVATAVRVRSGGQ